MYKHFMKEHYNDKTGLRGQILHDRCYLRVSHPPWYAEYHVYQVVRTTSPPPKDDVIIYYHKIIIASLQPNEAD